MKSLLAKTSTLITCLYQPSLSLVSDEPELKELLGKSKDEKVRGALRYVLSQDVSAVILGLRSIGEVETAVSVGKQFRGLTPKEQKRFSVDLGECWCRDCGQCLPCPQNINIPAIMRFHALYESYGLKEWAKKLYRGLEIKADKCSGCGDCEIKCPYNLLIKKFIFRAYKDLN